MEVVSSPVERRQLTVMFCDLVESTPLAGLLDPEDLHDVMSAYQQLCAEVVQSCEGYIAHYLGDGLLVYFGYPHAHEDDAARAVRAGLAILAGLQPLSLRLQNSMTVLRQRPLQVRIGVHTGLVVVSETKGERRELMAMGEAPHIANRLQKEAEPGTMIVSATTKRLTEGLFTYQDLGAQDLRGVSAPVLVYRVIGEREIRNRFEVAVAKGLTPLVGREQEIETLLQLWAQAKAGQGQIVTVRGEAGIGKSRLVQTLKERLATEAPIRLEYHCSSYHQHSVLYPVIDFVQRALLFTREDTAEEKFAKLEQALTGLKEDLAALQLSLEEAIPLLAELLALPLSDRYALPQLTPQRQKQKTLDILIHWVIAIAKTQPVLLVVEDLHWSDPSTLELFGLFCERQLSSRILTVLTFRPEFVLPWPHLANLLHITPGRLSHEQVETMVQQLTRGKRLPPEVVEQIALRTDGVPLFVEELTKAVLESSLVREQKTAYELTGPLPPLSVPVTLQDSLTARLDRLASVKEIAQLGAVLGREFSYDLLHILVPDEARLQKGLQQLVEVELVYQRGVPPRARYFFKHALVQDAAYQSLLKSKRRQLHRQIADMLKEQFADVVETRPELLAHHYTQAEQPNSAIPYWRQAGMAASDRAAHAEAIQHFRTALTLVAGLPDNAERDRLELGIQVSLGLSLAAGKGYAAPEVERTYHRARELCRRLGETTELFPILRGLWAFYVVLDDQKTARELAEQCLRRAQEADNIAYLIEAHTALGYSLYYAGELEASRGMLEHGMTLYELHRGSPFPLLTPQDPGVACLSLLSWVLWLLGYPDQALKRSRDSIALAQRLEHPFHMGFAQSYSAVLHMFRREPLLVEEHARAAVRIGVEQGLDVWSIIGAPYLGIAKMQTPDVDEGIAILQQALATWRAVGIALNRAYLLSGLAEGYRAARRPSEALLAVGEALEHVEQHGERFYQPLLYHLRGELFLEQPTPAVDEAEADFLHALTLAREQGARSVELRVATSLGRLWRVQGKSAQARAQLQEIHDWFREGFATKDFQDASALLAELG